MNRTLTTFPLFVALACTSQGSRVDAFAERIMGQLANGEYESVYDRSFQARVERIEEGGKLVGLRFLALGADPPGTKFIFKENMAEISMVRWKELPIIQREEDGMRVYKVQSKPDYENNKSTRVFVFVQADGELKFLGLTEKDNSYVRDLR